MNKSIKKYTVRRKSIRRKSVRRKSIRRKSVRRKSVRRKSVRRKSVRRKSKNNKDGVIPLPLPSDMLVNIRELSTCQDEYNLLASNVTDINDFTITANTCLKVKFLYISRNLSGFLSSAPTGIRENFLLKLKVYLCLHPEYYLTRIDYNAAAIFLNCSRYNEINALLTNIILIEAGTQPLTTANNDTIYVLNCDYDNVPVHFRGVTLHINTSQIVDSPVWLRSVVFYGFEEIIGYNFCSKNNNIRNISYKGMSSLRTVENDWMFRCIALETVDLRGLTSLETVRNNWMCECIALKTVDLRGLTSLRTVRNNWMYYCIALRTVDFTGLNSLRTVGDYWMGKCPLRTVDLRGLTSLETVGYDWMEHCMTLETININSNQRDLIPDELQTFARIV